MAEFPGVTSHKYWAVYTSSTDCLFKVRVPIPAPPPPPGADGRIRTVEELKGACQEEVDEVVLPRKASGSD